MGYHGGVNGAKLCAGASMLVNANESVQGDGQVGEADRLRDVEDDIALDVVASGILAMRFLQAYVEIVNITCAGSKGRRQTRQEGRLGRRVVERRIVRFVGVGTHLFGLSQLTTACVSRMTPHETRRRPPWGIRSSG